MKKEYTKPPLGIMPKNIWIEEREKEIWLAIGRYIQYFIDNKKATIQQLKKVNNWLDEIYYLDEFKNQL